MNKKVIIQIPFNVQNFNVKNELDENWIEYRLKIFAKYTLKSLKAQTNQFFTALLRCRDSTIPFIKEKITLPENVLIVGVEEYELKVKELIKDYNYLYLVRLDSDDRYRNTFVDILQNYSPKPETEVLINQNCYVYDIKQERLASLFYTSPPCYTLIYKTIEYNNGKRYSLKNGHGGAILLKHELLLDRNFMCTIHEKNNTSKFENFRKFIPYNEILDKKEIEEILKEFGV